MKYHSSPGERSLRIWTVSTLCIGRPASTSTLSTEKRSLPSTAASTMSKRSSALARTLEASLWGGMPPGTKTTRERFSSPMTCSAVTMCPWWIGSKVPPKIATFTPETSPEIEHRPADPDLVASPGTRAPQGAHNAAPLERAPLDALAGDDVAAVLLLYPHALPRRTKHAVLASTVFPALATVAQLAQPDFQKIPQLLNAFASLRRDLHRARKSLPQVRPQLLVQQVHLV